MGKLARLASIKSMKTEQFVYTPPLIAYDAMRVVIKADLDAVSPLVMNKVLSGLRRANRGGRFLLIMDNTPERSAQTRFEESGVAQFMDEDMRATDVLEYPMEQYANKLTNPIGYESVPAPFLVGEAECQITVTKFTRESITTVSTLQGIMPEAPQNLDVRDIYFTIGHLYHGAVLECDDQVFWGDDLLAVYEAGLNASGHAVPDILKELYSLRETTTLA